MNLKKELARAVRNRKFEQSDTGIYFPVSRLMFNNYFDISVNGDEPTIFPNRVVNQGLDHILDVVLRAVTGTPTWHIAPFAGNVTPTTGWTAANFTSNSTEFINYTQPTRQVWQPDTLTNQSVTNSPRALFTIGDGGQTTIWGAGLLSAAARSSTSGILLAAARLSAARSGLQEDDEVSIGYTVSVSDNS